jgi:hypothetical protein
MAFFVSSSIVRLGLSELFALCLPFISANVFLLCWGLPDVRIHIPNMGTELIIGK